MKMNFKQDYRFKKELKKLDKKYSNISKDLKFFQEIHKKAWSLKNKNNIQSFFNSKNNTILYGTSKEKIKIIKARLYSEDLNKNAIRVIYAIDFEKKEIILIEIYAKNQKEVEYAKRWKKYIK